MDAELDQLLAESLAIELRHRRGKGSVNRLEEIKRVCHSTYTNEDNWLPGRLIELSHRDTGSYIGLFQEMLHRRVNARKLVRVIQTELPAERLNSLCVEYVEGPLWLGGPFTHVVDPPTEADIAAVRKYFRPHYWKPAWKPARPKSADQLLNEITQEP